MIELVWIWALALLPLPWLVRRWLPAAPAPASAALRLPDFDEIAELGLQVRHRQGTALPVWAWLAWGLFCLALARPEQVGDIEQPPSSGRDLLLAVDVSGSMAADDMQIGGRRVDRLAAVKVVVGEFLNRRVGDRLGLILFGQQAYLMTPLTFDRNSVRYQLETSAVGLAGRETAIGDAIGLAAKRLRDRPQQRRVLILLTDGVNTAGVLTPERATELARDIGMRVYTVAIGSDATQSQSMLGLLMAAPPPEIDEASLRAIAEQTGGRFFRARDTQELAQIYAELDRLEPAAEPGQQLRQRDALYPYPLALALLVVVLSGLRLRRQEQIA